MARKRTISIPRDLALERGIINEAGEILEAQPSEFIEPRLLPAHLPLVDKALESLKQVNPLRQLPALIELQSRFDRARLEYGIAHGHCDERGQPLRPSPAKAGADESVGDAATGDGSPPA